MKKEFAALKKVNVLNFHCFLLGTGILLYKSSMIQIECWFSLVTESESETESDAQSNKVQSKITIHFLDYATVN